MLFEHKSSDDKFISAITEIGKQLDPQNTFDHIKPFKKIDTLLQLRTMCEHRDKIQSMTPESTLKDRGREDYWNYRYKQYMQHVQEAQNIGKYILSLDVIFRNLAQQDNLNFHTFKLITEICKDPRLSQETIDRMVVASKDPSINILMHELGKAKGLDISGISTATTAAPKLPAAAVDLSTPSSLVKKVK